MPAMVRVDGATDHRGGSDARRAAGARVIDLGSATLLPGLIDLHTHLTGQRGVHWEDALIKTTPGHDALWGARNAMITLRAGFTTVRDMGPTWPYVDVDLRDAIEAGAVPGPRMMVAGNYVSSTGGAGDARQFSIYVDVPLVRNLADGPDEIVKAVRTNFKNGADFIKILATGAVLSKGISPGAQQYSDEEIQAAVTEAHAGDARWRRMPTAPAGSSPRSRRGTDGRPRLVPRRRGDRPAEGVKPASLLRADALHRGARSKTRARRTTIPGSRARAEPRDPGDGYGGFQRALAAGLPIGFATDAMVIEHGDNAKECEVRHQARASRRWPASSPRPA